MEGYDANKCKENFPQTIETGWFSLKLHFSHGNQGEFSRKARKTRKGIWET
jgi:hypothetical protein